MPRMPGKMKSDRSGHAARAACLVTAFLVLAVTVSSSDRDIEAFVTRRLLKGFPVKLNVTGAGCTAFVARDADGGTVFARNFDFTYSPFLQLRTNPSSGYASMSTVNLSFAGYGTDYLPSQGIDKLQWSVVYDITGKTGRIWPHRRTEDGWDFGL